MTKLDTSVLINRPIEEVFAFATDLEKMPQWSAELVGIQKTSEGPMGLGTTLNSKVKMLGRQLEADNEVTAYEQNRIFETTLTSGPLAGRGGYSFESVNGATKVTFSLDIEAGGFFKMAEPLAARLVQRQFETNLSTLKDLMEAQA